MVITVWSLLFTWVEYPDYDYLQHLLWPEIQSAGYLPTLKDNYSEEWGKIPTKCNNPGLHSVAAVICTLACPLL